MVSLSDRAGGSWRVVSRMLFGTVCPTRSSREVAPMVASIFSIWSCRGPIWRSGKYSFGLGIVLLRLAMPSPAVVASSGASTGWSTCLRVSGEVLPLRRPATGALPSGVDGSPHHKVPARFHRHAGRPLSPPLAPGEARSPPPGGPSSPACTTRGARRTGDR